MIRFCLVFLFFFPSAALLAQQLIPAQLELDTRYVARIELHTADELMGSLQRAEMLQQEGAFKVGKDDPIVFVLHGSEARALFLDRYAENKALVDLAARLTAFKVVDIKVCETWMGSKSLDSSRLPPFIGTVPYGPAEEKRLLKQQRYVYF
jgi:uncharacterized protein